VVFERTLEALAWACETVVPDGAGVLCHPKADEHCTYLMS
jgi:hypothetical protein